MEKNENNLDSDKNTKPNESITLDEINQLIDSAKQGNYEAKPSEIDLVLNSLDSSDGDIFNAIVDYTLLAIANELVTVPESFNLVRKILFIDASVLTAKNTKKIEEFTNSTFRLLPTELFLSLIVLEIQSKEAKVNF